MEKSNRKESKLSWKGVASALVATAALTACTSTVAPNRPNVSPESSTQHPSADTQGEATVDLLTTDQAWNMAGAKLVSDADKGSDLHVTATGLAIVEQDGSEGYANPPVNLYGTRLAHDGDFSITYTVAERKGDANVSFHGEPPVILDEARAQMSTADLKLRDGKFEVYISDQTDGSNNDGAAYDIPQDDGETTVTMTKHAGQLSFTVDGQPTGGPISDHGIFDGGKVWIGTDAGSEGGEFTLTTLTVRGENGGSVKTVDTRQAKTIPLAKDGLAQLAVNQRPDFVLGTAVAAGPMIADEKYRKILFENFNGYTSENAAKWQTIHPARGIYNFTEMDAIVDAAQKTGAKVHGHTLIFGEANPQWVQDLAHDKEALKQTAIEHITTIMKRYKGKVKSWDVINEPLADYDTEPGSNGLRKNIWYETLGPDYLETFLRAAQEADPEADLVINDFGMESDEDRFNQMLVLVDDLKKKGINNLVIGFQAHIDEYDTEDGDKSIDTNVLQDRIRTAQQHGLRVRFSEVDISNESEHAVPSQIIKTCLGEKACIGVTTWVPVARYGAGGEVDNRGILYPSSGTLWDKDYKPTKSIADIKRVLR